jgi:hypothetical protein
MKWLFDDQPKAAGYRDYFEETLDANELEMLCTLFVISFSKQQRGQFRSP